MNKRKEKKYIDIPIRNILFKGFDLARFEGFSFSLSNMLELVDIHSNIFEPVDICSNIL